MKRFALQLLILVLLFLAAWIPRAMDLDAFVTPDEPRWISRSANFYQALRGGDLADTFQTDHPGVTAMWAGTLGLVSLLPEYPQLSGGQLDEEAFNLWVGANTSFEMLELLMAGRRWLTLAIALILALSYLPLRRLYGVAAAVVAVLFMAWNPFHVALSRQLHLDGLLSALVVMALLSYLAWLYAGRQWRYLIASGIVTGLAVLTKMPALLLLPVAGVLFLVEWVDGRRRESSSNRKLIWQLLAWGALVVATIVLLWPALWVNAATVIRELFLGSQVYAVGHSLPNYFLGEIVDDPGPLFYGVVYLFRTTPLVILGLIISFLLLVKSSWPFDSSAKRRSAMALLFFAIAFTIGMSLGAKKFDRYLLPVFLPLDILAGFGWMGLIYLGLRWWRRRSVSGDGGDSAQLQVWSAAIMVVVLFLTLGLTLIRHYPYYLTYYNPLMGGSKSAQQNMLIGWGNGLDEAATWLNQQPQAEQLRVVSWYDHGPLSYNLDSDERTLSYWNPSFWVDADFAVLYANQWQRNIPNYETVAHLASLEPVHVVESEGLELARIYDLSEQTPPAFAGLTVDSAINFEDRLRFSGYQQGRMTLLPGESTPLTLYLDPLQTSTDGLDLIARLRAGDGEIVWQASVQGIGDETPPSKLHVDDSVTLELAIPVEATPGKYAITVEFEDSSTGESLQPNIGGRGDGTEHIVGTIEVRDFQDVTLDAVWEGDIRLTAIQHQPRVRAGETLILLLKGAGAIDESLKISARLLDAEGKRLVQKDTVLKPEMRFELPLPDDAQPDLYTFAVVIYDAETLDPIASSTGEFQTDLVEITVDHSQ